MNKERLKSIAIDLLEKVDIKDIESISIDEQEYDDGAPYLQINIDYYPKGGER